MAERKKISEATLPELRDFAEIALGIEVDNRATENSVIGKIRAAGYEGETITVGLSSTPAQKKTSGKPAPYKTETVRNSGLDRETGKRQRAYYGIRIETHDGPGGEDHVPVGVNGRRLDIPRGVGVAVPEEYVEALNNAEQLVYDPVTDIGPNNPGGLRRPRMVKSYPFHFIPDDQVQFVVNQGAIKRAAEVDEASAA